MMNAAIAGDTDLHGMTHGESGAMRKQQLCIGDLFLGSSLVAGRSGGHIGSPTAASLFKTPASHQILRGCCSWSRTKPPEARPRCTASIRNSSGWARTTKGHADAFLFEIVLRILVPLNSGDLLHRKLRPTAYTRQVSYQVERSVDVPRSGFEPDLLPQKLPVFPGCHFPVYRPGLLRGCPLLFD